MALKLFTRRARKTDAKEHGSALPSDPDFNTAPSVPQESDPLFHMLQQGRAAAILREAGAWESHAHAAEIRSACDRLNDWVCIPRRLSMHDRRTNKR